MSSRAQRVRRIWERIGSEPGLKRNVLALVGLITLAGISGGIILTHQRLSPPWENKFTFYATFAGTPGVSPGHGQEVRIAGVAAGEIVSADVDNAGHARLKLSIDPQYQVYDNARVVLRPKSPLNEMYVELNLGSPSGKRLAKGGTLLLASSQRPIQIDEALGHLDDNARSALTALLEESDAALASAPQDLPAGLSATDTVVTRLKPVLTSLQTRRDTIQRLVTALSEISTAVGGDDGRLRTLADSLQTTLGAVGEHSSAADSALAQLPDLTNQLKLATEAVQSLSGELDPTLDNLKNASSSLPSSLTRLDATLGQLDKTLDQLGPVVQKAAPVVTDLRPYVRQLDVALPDLAASTARLDPVTASLVSYLPDLGGFILNTRSMTSLADANGGILRALLQVTPSSLPITGLKSLSTPAVR